MLEYVTQLLNKRDNIIDQLILLKENKDNDEVKKYIDTLTKINNSPYFQYCIDKYFFGKDVQDVLPTLPKLYSTRYATKKILELIDSEDNIIDQLKVLRKHNRDKRVTSYVYSIKNLDERDYIQYCIKKYYFGDNIEPMIPSASNLKIKLYNIIYDTCDSEIKEITQKENRPLHLIQIGDKIKVTNGTYKNTEGIVKYVNEDDDTLLMEIEIFGKPIVVTIKESFVLIK